MTETAIATLLIGAALEVLLDGWRKWAAALVGILLLGFVSAFGQDIIIDGKPYGHLDRQPGRWFITTQATPSPAPTPVPTPADCAELPPLNVPGFEGWKGRARVQAVPGQRDRYCFTVGVPHRFAAIDVGDATGAAQCYRQTTEYVPPATYPGRPPAPQSGRDTSYSFQVIGQTMAPGTYRINVESTHDLTCAGAYSIRARAGN